MKNITIDILIKWAKIIWNIIKTQFVYGLLNTLKAIILAISGFSNLAKNMQYNVIQSNT
jgi:hypothetical protein